MKLLMCRSCCDVLKLTYEWRSCECGKARGRYLSDGWHAEVNEGAEVIGIDNRDLATALRSTYRAGGDERNFRAWVFDPAQKPRIQWLPNADVPADV